MVVHSEKVVNAAKSGYTIFHLEMNEICCVLFVYPRHVNRSSISFFGDQWASKEFPFLNFNIGVLIVNKVRNPMNTCRNNRLSGTDWNPPKKPPAENSAMSSSGTSRTDTNWIYKICLHLINAAFQLHDSQRILRRERTYFNPKNRNWRQAQSPQSFKCQAKHKQNSSKAAESKGDPLSFFNR